MPDRIIIIKQRKPRKAGKGKGRKPKRQQGEGFWDSIKKAHDFVKSNKIISQTANVVGNVAGRLGGIPYADKVGSVAKAVEDTAKNYGYGRRVVRPKK